MSLQEAKQFVADFVTGDYTPEEYAGFLQWLRGATTEEMSEIADAHEAQHENWSLRAVAPSAEWIALLEEKLDRVVGEEEVPERWIGVRRFVRRKLWVAAASVVVLLSAGALWYGQHNRQQEGSVLSKQGSASSSLAQTMVNPRGGGQKQMTLADGSKVWLNAASTFTYPVAFGDRERVVELSGEAFFEVAPRPGLPFRVRIKDAVVTVLGTHFNIMAYGDDMVSRTTLIDGAVELKTLSEQKLLRPGEQAVVAYPSAGAAGKISVVAVADAGAAIAWRNGILQFDDADIQAVMRAVSRYYNVDTQCGPGMPTKKFTGSFPRGESLARVLKVVEGFWKVHCKNDGKAITVTSRGGV